MKTLIIGAGPAGLYAALLLKKADSNHDVTLVERNPAGATYGWGVVFSDRTLNNFREADAKTYKEITGRFATWEAIEVRYRGEVIRIGGNAFAGISRRALLNILHERCRELGVKLVFEKELKELEELRQYDLVIGADGLNSYVRHTFAETFEPSLEDGRARFIWFGTHQVFDSFTFIFRPNEHGLFQVHAYPFDGHTSTFIVECAEDTWRRAGLDQATEADSIAYCENLFAPDLGGHALLSNRSLWISFTTVKNRRWRHENVILLGDAAHTAHFSIGSGTKLAMEDAIALANGFEQHSELDAALNHYETDRRPRVEAFQAAAQESQTYFENVKRYLHLEPPQFTFHLITRSGRVSYDNLRQRDPHFVAAVDAWFSQNATKNQRPMTNDDQLSFLPLAPPPAFVPVQLREVALPNRLVLSVTPTDQAEDGLLDAGYRQQLCRLASAGAGLILTSPVAIFATGRISTGCPGLYTEAHAAAWDEIVAQVHARSPAKIGLVLNHAGRRGSTYPRWYGLDRPLRDGGWPLLATSPLPYTPRSPVPAAMTRADMDQVRDDFVRAAAWAREAGFDLLQLHFGHGYLLASFLSSLTNQRQDEYGGPLENRLRFPLELFDAARAVWPQDRPLSVAVNATDWARGGLIPAEAITIAAILKERGCDLIQVLAGQTVANDRPHYDPLFLVPYSDRIRHEAGISTLVGGSLATVSDAHAILAAGRADLCLLDTQTILE